MLNKGQYALHIVLPFNEFSRHERTRIRERERDGGSEAKKKEEEDQKGN